MCFVKLSLSLMMTIAFHISSTSSNKGDFSYSTVPSKISIIEVVLRLLLLCKGVIQIMYWGLAASEALHVLSNSQGSCSSISLAYWIGTALTVAGCLPDHRLITHGPYAYVRHPSYTGVFMCVAGIVMAQGSPGSWLRESGMLTTLFAVLVWSLSMGTVCICLFLRIKDEDELLKDVSR
ncbi:hypothetical protein V8E55_009391 [Tylopilus felleus]